MKHVGMINVRDENMASQSISKMLIVQKEIGSGIYVTYIQIIYNLEAKLSWMQMDYLPTGKAQSSIFYISRKCHVSLNVTEVLGEQIMTAVYIIQVEKPHESPVWMTWNSWSFSTSTTISLETLKILKNKFLN